MEDYRKKIENKIGRKLLPIEIVHHKDGNEYNNNLKNLEVISLQEHTLKPKRKIKITKGMIDNLLISLNSKIQIGFSKSLRIFFTPYQIGIIIKRLDDIPLSKTDREVYSRIIKKKLIGLANRNLFKIANIMLGY